ncbi:MAG TPA: ABC-2 family transporter protein [Actinomycetota bacterium]|nr:ABC-2 family transporter protein [Actinomycetota bacterium]
MAEPSPRRPEPLRSLSLAWTFLRIGAMTELQYRVNFFIQIFQTIIMVGTALAVLALVFSHTEELDGWSSPELLAVVGIHVLMGGIIRTLIQPNMIRLIEEVREGKLDYALTKPEDAQLLVSVRDIRIWQFVDVPVGATILGIALTQLDRQIGAGSAIAFGVALLLGATMIYCFWMILTIGAFWIVRMEFIVELFEGVYQAGRWPVTIYPGWLRASLTFLVPIGFAITVPAEAVTARLNEVTLLGAAIFAVLLFGFTRVLWRVGLKRYSGASA